MSSPWLPLFMLGATETYLIEDKYKRNILKDAGRINKGNLQYLKLKIAG